MIFQFDRDDAAYLQWLRDHPGGYVLNTNHSLSPRLTVVHRASCATINDSSTTGHQSGGFTERGYIKVYADDVELLRDWIAGKRDGGTTRVCKKCLGYGVPELSSYEGRFQIGKPYKKEEIYAVCDVPAERQRGAWDTGYVRYDGTCFVFCNIGSLGRTGHDYANRFIGDELLWYPRPNARPDQPLMKDMLDPSTSVLIFYREEDREPFVFHGRGRVARQESDPFRIVWSFSGSSAQRAEVLPQEVPNSETKYVEGAVKRVWVDARERNPAARAACIRQFGCACSVCGLDFKRVYGSVGADYIQVHHLVPLSADDGSRLVDPVNDLRPVCANCHVMLHRKDPPYTIDELRESMEIATTARRGIGAVL